MIENFVTNGQVYISKNDWKNLKEKYNQDEIIDSFVKNRNSINIPYQKYDLKDVESDFQKLLDLDVNKFICHDIWQSKYQYDWKFDDIYFNTPNIGNISSDYFHQINRFKCDSINAPSPERTWNNDNFFKGVIKCLFSMKFQYVDMKILRQCLSLRKYVAGQFKPSMAKLIYNYFNAESVLDFCSGWGDRLSGFYASNAKSYLGVDINQNLFDRYLNQIEFYNINQKEVKMINGFAEEQVYNKKFDFIFTSPPYYTIERYTQDENQSWKKYKRLDDWNENFLQKSIANAWVSLENSGKMVINISDVYAHHQINQICEPMNQYIKNKLNGKYFGCIGMKISERPNKKMKNLCEPLWIWEK